MLKDTLEKMQERIRLAEWDNDNDPSMIKKIKEMNSLSWFSNKIICMEESIYNIIPKEYKPDPKPPIYRSKYPPNIPPTGSTFCHNTTSKPGVNLSWLRSQTFQESLPLDYKPTQSMVTHQPWVISSMTGSLLLKISEKSILGQWAIALYLL